jgi:hypothetical protein
MLKLTWRIAMAMLNSERRSMKLPTKIRVGRRLYKIHQVKQIDNGLMGEVDYDTKEIAVATHSSLSGRRFKREEVMDTFWHELTHAILKDMNHPYESNEKFVLEFSSRLNKAIQSARF